MSGPSHKKWPAWNIILIFVISVLGALAGLYWLHFKGTDTVPLLVSCEDGRYYTGEKGYPEVCFDENWNQYMLDLGSQFHTISEIYVRFTKPESHMVLYLDKKLNVRKAEELGAGEHVLKFENDVAYIFFRVHIEEEEHMKLSGKLSNWESIKRKLPETPFTGKYLSVLGDSVSADPFYMPSATHFYADSKVKTTDMWWYRLSQKLGANICRVNAFGGSGVTDQTLTANTPEMVASQGRGKRLHAFGQMPDVILVLIGGNDILSNVPKERIAEDYRKMMRDIIQTYPNAEIYLATYYTSALNLSDPEGWMNQEIRKIAGEFKADLIDLERCGISFENMDQYLVDGSHPNKKGFQLIAAWAAKEMLK